MCSMKFRHGFIKDHARQYDNTEIRLSSPNLEFPLAKVEGYSPSSCPTRNSLSASTICPRKSLNPFQLAPHTIDSKLELQKPSFHKILTFYRCLNSGVKCKNEK